ncbi:hypothetical protein NUW58_g10698 [Xylaria curta]|uniref:Uncharacterized protein n=1 Tax=Xylaria curta TaxID=42375 RepID=A0ACC1MGY8_9PEZI|nr:hypothetical protein NUW58_g10698 [Xylaria curta]
MAYQYLRRGAVFLATNLDSTLPMSDTFFPGAGSISIPLINMTGNKPTTLGKPSQAMMDAIEGKFHFDRSRTCMVGDRLNTDIQFGIEGKLGGTLAVLTGVSKKEDWESEGALFRPAFYVDKLGDLRGGTSLEYRYAASQNVLRNLHTLSNNVLYPEASPRRIPLPSTEFWSRASHETIDANALVVFRS